MKKMILLFSLILTGATLAKAQELPKDSLYQVENIWRTQDGDEKDLKSFMGEPVILTMTYTGCKYSCPMTLSKLESIEADLKKKGFEHYHFVVASFDAERDTPEKLKAYMIKRKADPKKWTFLSAHSDEDVRKLAVLLEINYQKLDNGDFSHSNSIVLLNPQGQIEVKLKGLAASHAELVEKVGHYEKKY